MSKREEMYAAWVVCWLAMCVVGFMLMLSMCGCFGTQLKKWTPDTCRESAEKYVKIFDHYGGQLDGVKDVKTTVYMSFVKFDSCGWIQKSDAIVERSCGVVKAVYLNGYYQILESQGPEHANTVMISEHKLSGTCRTKLPLFDIETEEL